jgi:CheY-like chemotaxis protein
MEARPDQGRVVLSVWDEGVGIASDDQSRIFGAYEQVRNRHSANQGTGLGLYITQKLVQLHEGRIELQSQPGQGSRFTVILPGHLAAGPVDAPGPADVPGTVPSTGGKDRAPLRGNNFTGTILIVEDSAINQELMKSILDAFGCAYSLAENGEEAVALALARHFDLILMDIDLPGIDGIEAMRQIRRQSSAPIPIIALTAHVMQGDAERFVAAGMDGVISKPVEIARLRQLLDDLAVRGTPASATEPNPELETVYPAYDAAAVADSLGISPESLMAIVRRFLGSLAEEYSRRLQADIAVFDFPAMRVSAHKFRGAAANLRFERCAALLYEIESASEELRGIKFQEAFDQVQAELAALREELMAGEEPAGGGR